MPRPASQSPALAWLFCLTLGLILSSNTSARTESEIKAFYLYNFLKFIAWPDEPTDADFRICIAGDNPFSALTDQLNSLAAKGRKIQIAERDTPYKDCSVLFVSRSEANLSTDLLSQLDQAPILTVSDIDGFIDQGGMIGFIKTGNVVRFNINLQQTRASGLKMSAKLLELANRVEQ